MRCFALFLSVCLSTTSPLHAQDDFTVLSQGVDGIVPAEMLHAYLLDKVQLAAQRREEACAAIRTPEQIVAYQQSMRDWFLRQLGGLPARTPLNARVVGGEQREGYRVEKVIFESQPRHYVTAVLYLPESDPPYPGILVPCGHSAEGKARDLYQRAPIVMAQAGMAALCYDPLDQGERHQLLGDDGRPLITSSTEGHNLAGVGAILLGRNTATYRIWDGMRAIDFLASRPEVDARRIGCAGISGGGTLTSYLMALDDRIQAAAPGCYLTSFSRLLETIGPQDAEQTIYGQVGHGLDHADYVLMRAPCPTLIMTATRDFFDIDGAWHSFRQAKQWYGRLGYAERVDLIEVDSEHGFPMEMRVAAARWMRRWLLQIDDAVTETASPVATPQQLWCTPRGEVMLIDGARSVYDLNIELESELAQQRRQFWEQNSPADALAEVRAICGIRPLEELPIPACEKVGEFIRNGYRVDRLILRPEPGIYLPALMFRPEQPTGSAVLYLHAAGKHVDAATGGRIEQLVRQGHVVLAPDVRGAGETTAGGKHSYDSYLPTEWRDSMIAYLLGKPLLAMRAEDILVCARFVADYENDGAARPVHVVSIGQLTPAALHAAVLEPELISRTTLQGGLISWSNVVQTPLSKNQFANLIHGALRTYDLPDLCRSLPAEKLEVVNPVDANDQPVENN